MKSMFLYKIKRHISICDYEILWEKLSIGCIIAVFFIIRGCSYPIIWKNKLMIWIFCSDVNGDKTFYNIAISYIAAYLFYIFQIYYPEREKTKKFLSMTALDAYNFINQVMRFLFMWDYIAETTSDGTITNIKLDDFYYKSKVYDYISKGNLDEIKSTAKRAIEDYNKIVMSSGIQFVDLAIYKLLKDYNFEKELNKITMLLIGADIASETCADFFESYSREELNNIITRMNILIYAYGLKNIDSYEIVFDKKSILEWETQQSKMTEYWSKNKEFFEKLPPEYIATLK